MPEQTIEVKYPYGAEGPEEVVVYEWGVYEQSSVLAGQDRKQFLDMFNTVEEAKQAYPEAEEGYREAGNHMPDVAPAWFNPAVAGETW